MPTTLSPTEVETKPRPTHGSGGGFQGGNWGGDDRDGWGSWEHRDYGNSPQTYRLAMWLGMASILMLFVGLSSAYVFRQGLSQDWRVITLPPLLLPNTFLLLVSSLTLELARSSLRRRAGRAFQGWLTLTTILGLVFLAGQLEVWQSLTTQGIYLNTNPHSSFFYLMTGAHGAHLIGGVTALSYLLFQAWRSGQFNRQRQIILDITAMYWHFMDGLWIYLFLLLFVWR